MAMNQEQLDVMASGGCHEADCDHGHAAGNPLYLHGRCHVGGRIEVSYAAGSGVLQVACRECGKGIADVAVASEGAPA